MTGEQAAFVFGFMIGACVMAAAVAAVRKEVLRGQELNVRLHSELDSNRLAELILDGLERLVEREKRDRRGDGGEGWQAEHDRLYGEGADEDGEDG